MYVGLALAGWLLTFLPAVLQRIAPVLASMHSSAGPGKALTVSALTVPAAGKVLNAAHLAALVLLFAALAWQQQPALFRAARAVGAVGAVALLWRLVHPLRALRECRAGPPAGVYRLK